MKEAMLVTSTADTAGERIRRRLVVTGVVQGVGFRPFVYSLARQHGLTGFVGNDSHGVFIEVEGTPAQIERFQKGLIASPPPLAHIEQVQTEARPTEHDAVFRVVPSQSRTAVSTLISPDVSLCDDCRRELFDPADRRYRYPFINCTNCGPRFTIVQDIPYDRPFTTMSVFPMCAGCAAEYHDPLDRRFHAQPIACPACGPHLWLEERNQANGREHNSADVIPQVQKRLQMGQIIAVKGLGGFHLAGDAANDAALERLRQRKGRVDKPFAVMAPDLETVRQFAHLSDAEAALLTSPERPIVLLRQKRPFPLSNLVAPGNDFVGVMLPYTPLHVLLLTPTDGSQPPPVLIMTSANFSNEPIVKDNDEARTRLAPLADAFLMHNRDIHVHCDDSVVRLVRSPETNERESALLPLRRSRGYAPFPVKLPVDVPPTLAVGGELKATFCLTQDNHAFMSQHIGDMENLETLTAFTWAVDHMKALFRVQPARIVCDLHPGYLSTRWAEQTAAEWDVPLLRVQHHHAHITAVMAEHGLDGTEPVIGFSFDGAGYGPDGTIWGGEVLLADYAGFERVAHLKTVLLPGGDVSVQRPYRMALSHLWAAGLDWDPALPPVAACSPAEQRVLRQQLEKGINSVPTSSMGRLFDAVAALIGVRQTISYEGQAAIELETLAATDVTNTYEFDWNGRTFDAAPVMRAVAQDWRSRVKSEQIAAKFHNGVARLIVQVSRDLRQRRQINRVALSGGVFQNVTLLETAVAHLRAADFNVLTHHLVPPNDGGLALGQAVIQNSLPSTEV